jgi:hypothetical protein
VLSRQSSPTKAAPWHTALGVLFLAGLNVLVCPAPAVAQTGPTVTITTTSLPNGRQGDFYYGSFGADPLSCYTWSVSAGALPPGVALFDGSDTAFPGYYGYLSGTPTTPGTYNFTIRATGISCGLPAVPPGTFGQRSFTVTIAELFAFSSGPPARARRSQSFSHTFTTVNGYPPVSYALTSGSVPGLALASNGVLSGTPTTAGSYPIVVSATESSPLIGGEFPSFGATITQSATVHVDETLQITTTTLPDARVAVPYSQTIATTGGGPAKVFSITTGTLPSGLSLNSTTGVISGTPGSLTGASLLQVSVTDGFQSASRLYSLGVLSSMEFTTSTLPAGTVGSSYSAGVSAANLNTSGPVPNVSGPVAALGSLPPGLSVLPGSGTATITGTPTTAGTYNFTMAAEESPGVNRVERQFSITINPDPALTLSPSSVSDGAVALAYSVTFSVSGGTGPFTFEFLGSQVPGLTFSAATRTLSGVPTTAGTYPFQVRVTDSATEASRTNSYSLVVHPRLLISTTSLPGGNTGSPYSATLAYTGGNPAATKTWSRTAGSLPPGLSVSSAGVISGTPTTPGTSYFTIRVTDGQQIREELLSITVTTAFSFTTASGLPHARRGQPYSMTLLTTGGIPPISFSLAGGALPPGILLASNGNLSGTPVSAGTFVFTVQAQDTPSGGAVAVDATTSREFTLVVDEPLTITTTSLPGGTRNVPYSTTIATNGGVPPVTFSVTSGSLPPGLVLSSGGTLSGTPSVVGSSTFTVRASDASEQSASRSFTLTISGTFTILTTSLPSGTLGQSYSGQLEAAGGGGTRSWSITNGNLPPGITLDGATGALGGRPTQTGSYRFSVSVTSGSETAGPVELIISVQTPPLDLSPASLAPGVVDVPYSVTFTGQGGAGTYRFELARGTLPAGFTLDSGGLLSGKPAAAGDFNFDVRVVSGESTVARSYTLRIDPPPLTINPATLPTPVFGSPYTFALVIAGGTPPYTAQITAGGLPLGLSMSSLGGFSGTPTRAGDYSFTVQVTDSARRLTSRTYSVTVTQVLSLDTTSLPGGFAGEPYSGSLAASGGRAPYSFSVSRGALPSGVSLSTAGVLSGTPGAAGRFAFTASVSDAAGGSASRDLFIDIVEGVTLSTDSLNPCVINEPCLAVFAATGGVGPYVFDVTAGTLPEGLNLLGTGVLSGTPTREATARFTVRVTDSRGRSASREFTLAVLQPLRLSTESLPDGEVGVDYSALVGATGGLGPYVFDISAGSLPAGLALAGNRISGQPSAAGVFRFTLRVTDALRRAVSRELSITIYAVLTLNPATLPVGVTGTPYSAALPATGGREPYRFVVREGSLPAGVTLNETTGALGGAPTATGAFAFTVEVSDARGRTASRAYSLTVLAPLTVTTTSLAGGVVGAAYSQALAAAGGRAPYTWSVTGALPGGIALNSASGDLTGTPTAAAVFNFTAVVTDADGRTAQRALSIEVVLPPLPALRITGLPATAEPQTQPSFTVASGATYPVALAGRIRVSFLPDSGSIDDPGVQLASGGRTLDFNVAVGSTNPVYAVPRVALQTGSVAGQIVVTAVWVRAGVEVAPPGGAEVRVRVPAAPPVISRSELVRSSTGFSITITGWATSRQITRAIVRLNPVPGATLSQTEFIIPLAAAFEAYWASPAGQAAGGLFVLTLPFTITGEIGAIQSVTVTLENALGPSQVVTINL